MLGGICHPEFYRYVDQEVSPFLLSYNYLHQAFAIFIQHTSFQLYHCEFQQEYLRTVHDNGVVDDPARVNLKVTPPYNFCDPSQRREWFDIVVALFQYLQSGESKVGFLNRKHPKNMLHKDIEADFEAEENTPDEIEPEEGESEGDQIEPNTVAGPVQSSTRKRASDKEAKFSLKAKRRRREPPIA